MDKNVIVLCICIFAGLSIGIIIFLMKIKSSSNNNNNNNNNTITNNNSNSTQTVNKKLVSQYTQTDLEQARLIQDYLEIIEVFNQQDDNFTITRGEGNCFLFIYSLKLPYNSLDFEGGDEIERKSSVVNVRKAVRNVVSQYIRLPGYDSSSTYFITTASNYFLRRLYSKEGLVGRRIGSDFTAFDAFQIVNKFIKGLRKYYERKLTGYNMICVVLKLYELEDNILNNTIKQEDRNINRNNRSDGNRSMNIDSNRNTSMDIDTSSTDNTLNTTIINNIDNNNLESYNTFLSYFFSKNYVEFLLDFRENSKNYKKQKKFFVKEWKLGKEPVLCIDETSKIEYDILDFMIYVCSKVLTSSVMQIVD